MTDLDVAVVGAGPAGLAAAYALHAAGRTVHVFEAHDAVGGRTRAVRRHGAVFDTGAEMLGVAGYPATWRLVRALGLDDDCAPPIGRDIAVWRRGRVVPGLGERGGRALGPFARAALAVALARRRDVETPEAHGDRPLARVRNRELRDYLLEPLAAGFFGWDVERACAGPMLAHLRAVGSPSTYRAYRGGMDALSLALAEHLDVSTGVPVRAVTTTSAGARLVTDAAALTARQIVLAVPAPVAARLHPGAPAYVHACEYRPMVKVVCLLDRPLGPETPSFALAVPRVEDQVVAGLSFDDRRCADRAPQGMGMIGIVAARPADWLEAPDEAVAAALVRGAARFVPGLTEAVRATVVARFADGLPMPTPAAMALRPAFVGRAACTVDYAGDWESARPCAEGAVRSAEKVAARILGRVPVLVGSGT
ncbi:FAD-dependent oxidoreductase [Actinokineospora pegani]|uniref:FAD-dependent oxidoreductase n=1 Tax=Actinokineospora pegani TaxID=2654637 RepID=UPI0018D3BB9E|nr:FAD-dependent oxidoreductase [Actinokineospora pegani]